MKWENENCTEQQLYEFLLKVDKDFPVNISSKVFLPEYAKKLVEHGSLFIEKKQECIVGLVAGYIQKLTDEMAYIAIVAVEAGMRGQGIANRLLEEFCNECRTRDIQFLHLYTDKRNAAALGLYEKVGFEIYNMENEPRPDDVHLLLNLRLKNKM